MATQRFLYTLMTCCILQTLIAQTIEVESTAQSPAFMGHNTNANYGSWITLKNDFNNYVQLGMTGSGSPFFFDNSNSAFINTSLSRPLLFNIGGQEVMRLTKNGLRIGESKAPYPKIMVLADSTDLDMAVFEHLNPNGSNSSFRIYSNSASGTARIENRGNGMALVVVNSGMGEGLLVAGSARRADGKTTWDVLSDKKVKRKITAFTDGLNTLLQIQPKTFEYNGKHGTIAGKASIGIIAQEIQEIAPYLVSSINVMDPENPKKVDEEVLQYNPHALTYIIINAIKEQQETIKSLENKLRKMELSQVVK